MTFAVMTESVQGIPSVMLRREGYHKIIISTNNTLSDEHMNELYWIILAMEKTGKTWKEIINKSEEGN